jgi:hypothetical protein
VTFVPRNAIAEGVAIFSGKRRRAESGMGRATHSV